MSDTNWAPPTGPPITGRKLDPKLLGLGGGVVAALVIAVVAAVSVGGDGGSGDGSGRQYLVGPQRINALPEAPSEEPGRQWEYDGDTETVRSVAVTEDAVILAGLGTGGTCTIRSLKVGDGEERWATEISSTDSRCGDVALTDDRIIALSELISGDIEIVALSLDKGKEQGRSVIRNADALTSVVLVDPEQVHAYVAIAGDGGARMVRVDTADARRSWSVEGRGVMTGEMGLLVTRPDAIEYVDYETGDTLWDVAVDEPFAVAGGSQVLVSTAEQVIAYDINGERQWADRDLVLGTPLAVTEALGGVFVIGGGEAVVIDESGESVATGAASGTITAVDGDEAVIVAGVSELSRLERDGDELKVVATQRYDRQSGPIISRNALLVSDDGSLVAIDPESFEVMWELDDELSVWAVGEEAMVTVDGEKVTYWR